MDESVWLAERFEVHRPRLRAVAYRVLGSLAEADDAVQEAWLRLGRSDTSGVENLGGWLTTVVARVSLDMLRSRQARREEPLDAHDPDSIGGSEDSVDPEQEVLLADSVGLALLVVLDTLAPAERVVFVLHELFTVPFDEIARVVGRSPAATRQLASRARRRVRGSPAIPGPDLARQREVVDTFLAAARSGDFDALVAVFDPDVVLRADRPPAHQPGAPTQFRGAHRAAKRALTFSRAARFARPALINGTTGVVVAPRGRLFGVLSFTFTGGKITEVEVIADPPRLRQLDLAALAN